MQPLQRTAVRSARRLRPQIQRQNRRNASESHGSHDSHSAQPKNESIGAGFYIAIAAVPASVAVFQYSREGGEQHYFTRLIKDTYADYKTQWEDRNDMHTRMLEQAAADKVLFLNEAQKGSRRADMRFPEQFNVGSPWNVPAGHGSANIDQIIAKYEKENNAEQEKKFQQLKDNNVPAEQPVEPLIKAAPMPSN